MCLGKNMPANCAVSNCNSKRYKGYEITFGVWNNLMFCNIVDYDNLEAKFILAYPIIILNTV